MERTEEYIEQQFKKINRVEPSPFLWTQLKAKLESSSEVTSFQPRLALAAMTLLVVINVSVISFSMSGNDGQESAVLLSELNIKTLNQLYSD